MSDKEADKTTVLNLIADARALLIQAQSLIDDADLHDDWEDVEWSRRARNLAWALENLRVAS